MKKVVSLLLALLMIFSLSCPAFAADEADMENPLIYVRGAGKHLYASDSSDDESTRIYPSGTDIGEVFSNALKPCLEQLAKGLLTDDYDAYCDELYNAYAPIFEKFVLGETGRVTDGSGDGKNMATEWINPNYDGVYNTFDYDFGYDFRVSPLEVADELKDYIDRVVAVTGKKVALLGRCLGGNVISAYLAKYEQHAIENVSNVILYVTSTEGVDVIGSLFAGKIDINSDDVDRFVEYAMTDMVDLEDPVLESFIITLVDLLNYAKVLGLGTDALQAIVDNVKDNLVPRLGLASYASFPSYWSMVSDEYYEDAKKIMFKGREEQYAQFIELIDEYHYGVQCTAREVMNRLKENGMGISVIAKYNIPNIPVYANASDLGDNVASTKQLSFGATCAKTGEVLSADYINSLADTRYLSPDHKIDASTCLYPDNTWFIKDVYHTEFPYTANEFIGMLVDSKGEMTVFDDECYPQYMQYDVETEEISPVTGLDPQEPAKGSGEERFSVIIRFMTALFNFLSKLLKGEFSLSLEGLLG